MKAVILAGGLGTRFAEETQIKPKPMIEIGGKPILWHILKGYSAHGINEFVICLGYKGYLVKEFFANYCLYTSDITFDMEQNRMEVHRRSSEPWRVTLVDTGDQTQTGGRVRAIRKYVKNDEFFCLTYGDGVGNVDLKKLIEFHRGHKKLCTLTAVQPPGRFGSIELSGERVSRFVEKPQGDGAWINGGFFVVCPSVIESIEGPGTVWENEPLQRLALDGQLMAYRHHDFWQPMDTLRDKNHLESLWSNGKAPWRVWE